MKISSLLLSAALSVAVACGQAPTSSSPSTPSGGSSQLQVRGPDAVAKQDPNRVVATINGKPITAKEANNFLKAIPPEQLKRYETNLPTVVQQIYMSKELAQQAAKMSLDQQSPVKEQLQLTHDQILAQAYLNKMSTNSAGPAPDPQAYYNSHQPEFDKVKLSGIFVGFNPPGTPATGGVGRTEEQAKAKADDLEKKLKAGGDFSTLARTDSDNQQAAAKGGELGSYSINDPQLPAQIKTAVEKLQAGQTSEPMRIPNALLIVKLDSRNKETYEQAKAEITQKLQQEQSQAAVKQEIDKYKIQVQDPAFFNGTGSVGAHPPSLAHPGGSASAAPPAKP